MIPSTWLNLPKRWPLWLLAALLAPLWVNRLAPDFLDADSLIPPLTSTQHLTLFYWGQERYANVLPLLLAPIRDLFWSLRLHLFSNTLAYLLLLEAIVHIAGRAVMLFEAE